MIVKKKKRWKRNREKMYRRKRNQVLVQGECDEEMALLCVMLPLYRVTVKEIDAFNVIKTVNVLDTQFA
jgi:hypothetical protein